jgi:hypothetical protein
MKDKIWYAENSASIFRLTLACLLMVLQAYLLIIGAAPRILSVVSGLFCGIYISHIFTGNVLTFQCEADMDDEMNESKEEEEKDAELS